MIKFFRKIRQNLLMENKTGKYFKYALGEIALVVIGILIALQINNWNIKTIDAKKEKTYLIEIKENLKTDLITIDSTLIFNKTKKEAILNVLENFSNSTSENDVMIVKNKVFTLGVYEHFFPNDLGFKNLISAENITLIRDIELRKLLLKFYNFDFKGGIQERMRLVTRDFVDYTAPVISTKELFKNMYNVTLDIPSNKNVELSKDQQLLSLLWIMDTVIDFQNNLLLETKKDIQKLIGTIENQ
ncbi:DUF6090 family protein [Lacinutrix iliipiscaria]|uniref:DUF6090 family protein n=1 Tax=Lacinutrix iliipiscaria TaxID=1230532 RepID=A0ABW5WTD2_9FLAO